MYKHPQSIKYLSSFNNNVISITGLQLYDISTHVGDHAGSKTKCVHENERRRR